MKLDALSQAIQIIHVLFISIFEHSCENGETLEMRGSLWEEWVNCQNGNVTYNEWQLLGTSEVEGVNIYWCGWG